MSKITYIDEVEIKNKTVLLRVDFNVSLNADYTISNSARIEQSLPTIKYLLKNKNRLIILSHLGRPKGVDEKYSLKVVVNKLKDYLPDIDISLAKDIIGVGHDRPVKEEIVVLENIRFFPKEKDYSTMFARQLASLGDVYVNDAFGVCHRSDTSVIGPPKFLPAFGGLLLKKELSMISLIINKPKKPIVAIIGGAKVSTKVGLINKLIKIVDYLIIGGGLANTFVSAQGNEIGNSFCEYEAVQQARKILSLAKKGRALIVLPVDAVVAKTKNDKEHEVKKINNISSEESIFDIGPETKAQIGGIIAKAKTIIWNGPVGYFENPAFKEGTDFVYYSIAQNTEAVSIVGGGDTLAAISKKEYLDKITHISTGGGAMLELIEKGTLPGIEALKK
jgi:phosphoglycerate kinase